MKRAQILYFLVVPLTRIMMWVYYRKIHLSNMDRIPQNKPVILGVNHPTGFSEPVILAMATGRPLYFLVRGDFFQKPIFRFLLRSLNMVPIYRRMDTNFRGVAQNLSTFEECYQTLRANRTLCIFPEGNTKHEKKLRPLQKGLGRIAHGALERFTDMDELYVVPVGVNYTYAEQPRSTVMIDFGEPINVAEIRDAYPDNRMRTVTEVTKTLHREMGKRIVQVKDDERKEIIEYMLRLQRSEYPEPVFPIITQKKEPLRRELAVAREVQSWSDEHTTEVEEAAHAYFNTLKKYGIRDDTVATPSAYTAGHTAFLMLTALPALLGQAFIWLPRRLAFWIRDTKVKRIEFFSPVLQAAGLGAFLGYYFFWIILSLALGVWWLLPFTVLLGMVGYLSTPWRESLARWQRSRTFRRLPKKEQEQLKKQRATLLEALPKGSLSEA